MKSANRELERWLLEKAKASKNRYDAQSWILTAKTLSESYEVELTGYKLQCQFSSVSGATEAIQQLYVHFSNEPGFWAEIAKLVEAVRSDHNDDSSSFLRAVFQNLMPELQQTMLLALAEKQSDKVEQCRFLLLLLRLFPDSAATFGMQLMQLLTELEKTSSTESLHSNPYLSLLVNEVTPILLKRRDLTLHEAACINLLKKSILFYVSCVNEVRHPAVIKDEKLVAEKSGQSLLKANGPPHKVNFWDGLLEIFRQVAIRCNWQAAQLLRSYRYFREEDIAMFSKRLTELPANSSELFYSSLLLLYYAVFNFFEGRDSAIADGQSIVLVPPDAHFEPFTVDSVRFPGDGSPCSTFLQTECPEALVRLYSVTVVPARFIADDADKDDLSVVLHADKYRWIKELFFRSLLLAERFVCLSELVIDRSEFESMDVDDASTSTAVNLSASLHLIGCHLGMNARCDAVRVALALIERLDHPKCLKNIFRSSSWHFRLLTSAEVFSYLLRVIAFCLWYKVLSVGLESSLDLLIGHLIVVLQSQWPACRSLFDRIFDHLKERGSFAYEQFFTYVHHPEVLMKFAFVLAQCDTMVLILGDEKNIQLSEENIGQDAMNTKVKLVRQRIEAQLAKVKPDADQNLIAFFREEGQSILTCLST